MEWDNGFLSLTAAGGDLVKEFVLPAKKPVLM
jgi:hypothetical protein